MAEPRKETGERTRGRTDIETTQRTEQETARNRETRAGGLMRREPFTIGDPFTVFNTMRRRMDHLFDDFGFGGIGPQLWSPQIEMYEKNGKLHVAADLPGLDKKDVKVELNDNVLTIEGERKDEQKDERGGWSERSYGHFFRSIPLPDGINTESCNATFNNGVLEVTVDMPKQTQPKGKQIEIR